MSEIFFYTNIANFIYIYNKKNKQNKIRHCYILKISIFFSLNAYIIDLADLNLCFNFKIIKHIIRFFEFYWRISLKYTSENLYLLTGSLHCFNQLLKFCLLFCKKYFILYLIFFLLVTIILLCVQIFISTFCFKKKFLLLRYILIFCLILIFSDSSMKNQT